MIQAQRGQGRVARLFHGPRFREIAATKVHPSLPPCSAFAGGPPNRRRGRRCEISAQGHFANRDDHITPAAARRFGNPRGLEGRRQGRRYSSALTPTTPANEARMAGMTARRGILPGAAPRLPGRSACSELRRRGAGTRGQGRSRHWRLERHRACLRLAFAAEGARIAICSRSRENIDAAVARLKEVYGLVADLVDAVAAERVVETVEDRVGPIDILVNSAGAAKRTPPDELNPAAWREAFDAKFFSYINVIDPVVKRMAKRGGGNLRPGLGGGDDGVSSFAKPMADPSPKPEPAPVIRIVRAISEHSSFATTHGRKPACSEHDWVLTAVHR